MTGANQEHTQPNRTEFTRLHKVLISVISGGAVLIAGIGFIGSYKAVQQLAADKGFGAFAHLYPIGVDAGIVVLLAMSLLLSWLRIPFPLLRQTAWLLTGATVAFNAAAAWPDPLGTAMHAVIPVLFVVTVEAARHAVGRYAAITAGKNMDSVRASRWVLSPWRTFRLWRGMRLYELRDYDKAIKLEQARLVYETRLHARYGPAWRREAPVEDLLPLKLVRFGVPLNLDSANSAALPENPGERFLTSGSRGSTGTEPWSRPGRAAAGPETLRPNVSSGEPTDGPDISSTAQEDNLSSTGSRGPHRPAPPPADGRTAVQRAYDALPEAERTQASARSLAQRLAPDLGLKESTVRIYINELRKQHRPAAAVRPAPSADVEAGTPPAAAHHGTPPVTPNRESTA